MEDDILLPDMPERDMSDEAVQKEIKEFRDYWRKETGEEYEVEIHGELPQEVLNMIDNERNEDLSPITLTQAVKKYLANLQEEEAFLTGFDDEE